MADPTGAGDTFAGGFVGYIASQDSLEKDVLRRAMAYGTAIASYNVEEFGTERVARLTADEINGRVEELARVTVFDASPVPLRAWATASYGHGDGGRSCADLRRPWPLSNNIARSRWRIRGGAPTYRPQSEVDRRTPSCTDDDVGRAVLGPRP